MMNMTMVKMMSGYLPPRKIQSIIGNATYGARVLAFERESVAHAQKLQQKAHIRILL